MNRTIPFVALNSLVEELKAKQSDLFTQIEISLPDLTQPEQTTALREDIRALIDANPSDWAEHSGSACRTLGSLGIGVSYEKPANDLSALFVQAIVDDFLSLKEHLPLRPVVLTSSKLDSLVEQHQCHDSNGTTVHYCVGKQGHIPLVIINSLGVSIECWQPLLADKQSPFKAIIWQGPGCDAFHGGADEVFSLEEASSQIQAIVDAQNIEQLHILGWCNGGRIAIDVAHHLPEKLASLTLLSATMRGLITQDQSGSAQYTSQYENNLHKLYQLVAANPAFAHQAVKVLAQQPAKLDWSDAAQKAQQRNIEQLLTMGTERLQQALSAPLRCAEHFANYGQINRSHEDSPLHLALNSLKVPLNLMSGSHDGIVDNQGFVDTLSQYCQVNHLQCFGAGHYWQYQQYPYFAAFLENLILAGPPLRSARVRCLTELPK